MDEEFFVLNTSLKKKRLFHEERADVMQVNYSQEEIIKLIPHRAPFLFLHTITKVSLAGRKGAGTYYINPNDDLFKGHFPGKPIFPGVLQIEMMGQLGICLSHFVANNTVNAQEIRSSLKVVATHIRDAAFIHSLFPGDTAGIEVFLYDTNELNGVIAGQIYNQKDELCLTAIMEVYYLE